MNLLELENFIKRLPDDGIVRRLDELGRVVIPVDYKVDDFIEESTIYLFRIGEYVVFKAENEDNRGIEKTLDELGRAVINIEIRRDLNWEYKDFIAVWRIENYIVMKKVENKCIFCKSTEELIEFKNKLICKNCKKELIKAK